MQQPFAAVVRTRATESFCRADPLPAYPPKPSPKHAPAPEYLHLRHHTVLPLVQTLRTIVSLEWNYIPPCTETAFALIGLAALNDRTDSLHDFFWSPSRRAYTAGIVQRVIESGQHLIIPAPWTSAAHALNMLSQQEAHREAALKRTLAPAQSRASGSRAGVSPPKTQTPRLTRAAAARQQQLNEASANDAAASPSNDRRGKHGRSPPPTPVPHRASARQQKKPRAEAAQIAEDIPPTVVAPTACPLPTRARSASQESNETLVASTSSSASSSPTSSRAVSVSSADTAVGIEVASSSKGKGRFIAPAPVAEDAVPIGTEAGVVTRSRTRNAPETNPARAAPYPATKAAQLESGRGQSKKAPTGKRKAAKPKAN
ncbi:hypothetical protein DFH08DRAFT_869221 [Mycena albidolilacea]|uniref:Uncharacterized protein n=1 Tax=Mycena albidolilacea TaxID=1033008 RepID=A0AAD6ZZU4_9AGAR|nr:hypothetical protein DFH08DRAFT_869221 [Mycena albidolilacea]